MKRILIALLLLGGAAQAADNITVLDSTSTTKTVKMKDVGAGILASQVVASDTSGNALPTALTPVVANNVSSLVLKASAGSFYSLNAINYSSTAGFAILYNATAAPAPGALTASLVLSCSRLPGSGQASLATSGLPAVTASTGLVVLLTSGADCVTYTTGTITGYIAGQVQ